MHARKQSGLGRAWIVLGICLVVLTGLSVMVAALSHTMGAVPTEALAGAPPLVVGLAASVAGVLGLAEYLPIINLALDLVNDSSPISTPAILYDVFQGMAAAYMAALGLRWLAARTPWTWDDGPTRALVGYLIRGLKALAELITASGGEKPRMPPGVR